MDGQLRNAGHDLGRLDLQQLQHRRHQVDRVAELAPECAGPTESLGPVDDQRIANAAAVRVLLVPLERGVPRLRPAPRDVGVAVRSTDVVQARHGGVDVLWHAIEPAHLVEHAGRSSLLARAVVGHDDEQGVVEPLDGVQEVHQPTDLLIGMVEHRGECLLQARREQALVRSELGPRAHAGIARRELGALRYHAERELAREPFVPHGVPALVEAATVLLEERLRRLVRRVRGAERHVREERSLRYQRDLVADVADGAIDDVF